MGDNMKKQLETKWNNELEFDEWKQARERDWKKLIQEQLPELGKAISTDGSWFTLMESKKVLDRRTHESIKHQIGMYAQVSATLQALGKQPFANFILFCEALIETSQVHVIVEFLTPEVKSSQSGGSVAGIIQETVEVQAGNAITPVDYDWRACILHNYDHLTEHIDPDSGLMNELLSRRIVDSIFVDVLKSCKGRVSRVAAIIDHLTKFRPESDFVKFCQALEVTNQMHVVESYLSKNCLEPASTVDNTSVTTGTRHLEEKEQHQLEQGQKLAAWLRTEHRELCKDWKTALNNTRPDIAEKIDTSDEFTDFLVKFGVMNSAIGEYCREETNVVARTDYILDYMHRRSSGDFTMFCQALHNTGQGHIVRDYLSLDVGKDVPDTPLQVHDN